jgi:hypothetical protein
MSQQPSSSDTRTQKALKDQSVLHHLVTLLNTEKDNKIIM